MRGLLCAVWIACATPALAEPACRQPPGQVDHRGAKLSVVVEGAGPPVLMIPSLGRGPADFDELARDLVGKGYTAVRYEPRWFGASRGPVRVTLDDLAGDAHAVAAAACPDHPVVVIGHALGNRIARAMAATNPSQTASIILLAAGGQIPIAPDIQQAISVSAAEGRLPDSERLTALKLAFFAPGQNAQSWLTGWSPRAAELQARAVATTQSRDWITAGGVPLFIIQPMLDPVAPIANGEALIAQYPGQAVMVTLDHASHAILPEQPAAISALVEAWLAGERNAGLLQQISDDRTMQP